MKSELLYLQLDFSSCLEVHTQQADFLFYGVFTHLKYTTGQTRIHGLKYLSYFHFLFSWPEIESRVS